MLLLLLPVQLRVHIDGVLAGLYPVFYTFYTVGGALQDC
jgi:hypothetical protein